MHEELSLDSQIPYKSQVGVMAILQFLLHKAE